MMDNSYWKIMATELMIIGDMMKMQDSTLPHVFYNFSALPL